MDVAQELHRYRYEIEDALSRSRTISYQDLPGLIEAGKLALYANDRAILIVEPIRLTVGWILCMFVAAGEMDHVMALVDHAEAVAKEKGASGVAAIGRPGWIKNARKRGYRIETVTLVKEL